MVAVAFEFAVGTFVDLLATWVAVVDDMQHYLPVGCEMTADTDRIVEEEFEFAAGREVDPVALASRVVAEQNIVLLAAADQVVGFETWEVTAEIDQVVEKASVSAPAAVEMFALAPGAFETKN